MQLPHNLPIDAVLGLLYQYIPNKGAAAAAVVLYALLSIAVAAVSIKTRLYYMLLVALTALLELAGELAENHMPVCYMSKQQQDGLHVSFDWLAPEEHTLQCSACSTVCHCCLCRLGHAYDNV